MRSLVCKLAILSILLVSVEGAADVVVNGVPHGDPAGHLQEFGHSLEAHSDESSNAVSVDEHCEHCCHGNCSSISQSELMTTAAETHGTTQTHYVDQLRSLFLSPPTPPPDAHTFS